MQLTSIKNLLGRQGGHFLIFGLLMRREDGAFCLEDLDDKVELDLSEATPESGLFTEGSFVLIDGEYTLDSIFKVNEMGHPPSERREEARKVFGHVDFDGQGAISLADEVRPGGLFILSWPVLACSKMWLTCFCRAAGFDQR